MTAPASVLPFTRCNSTAPDLVTQGKRAATSTRRHAIATIYHAGSGHPGSPLSCTDILACLFGAELNFWPGAVHDADRYRSIANEFIGVRDTFGTSGDPEELADHSGISAQLIAEAAVRAIARKRPH